MLDVHKQTIESSSLIDYKIWCFHGKDEFIWTCFNRSSHGVETGCYDQDWNYHPEWSTYTHHYKKAIQLLPKPKSLHNLIEIAEVLSNVFPDVRVDFYEVDGKPYFGEITYSSVGGYMTFFYS